MADERIRIEIGFEGGQLVSTFVESTSADQLQKALHEDGPRVVVVETEDGPLHVIVPRVVYFKRFVRSGRVGFTAA